MPEQMPPRASHWLRFLRWLRLAPPHPTCMWCPECGNELTTCPDSKFTYSERDECVVYGCAVCELESLWLMDAPVPILLEPKG